MTRDYFPPSETREALKRLPEVAAQENLTPPSLAHVHVPLRHRNALGFDSTVVVGMRGAGKSLWTAALQADTHRPFIAGQLQLESLKKAVVRVGFGLDESNKLVALIA